MIVCLMIVLPQTLNKYKNMDIKISVKYEDSCYVPYDNILTAILQLDFDFEF